MLKIPITLLTCLIVVIAHSQKSKTAIPIKLYGKVENWENQPVLYYTLNDEPFSSKRYVKLDKDMNYTLDLSKTVYKTAVKGKLVFSVDTSNKPSNEDGCMQHLQLEELYNYAQVSGQKQVDMHADLPLTFNCMATVWYGAEDDNEKFAGRYQMQVKDTIYYVKLDRDLFRYTSTFTPSTNDYTNEEWGSWNYDDNGYLNFNVQYRRNRASGIMIESNLTRKFKVITNSQNRSFQLESAGSYSIKKI